MKTILPGTIGALIGLFPVKVFAKIRIMTGTFFTTISYLCTYSFIHSFIYYFSHLLQNPLRHDYITKGDG